MVRLLSMYVSMNGTLCFDPRSFEEVKHTFVGALAQHNQIPDFSRIFHRICIHQGRIISFEKLLIINCAIAIDLSETYQKKRFVGWLPLNEK